MIWGGRTVRDSRRSDRKREAMRIIKWLKRVMSEGERADRAKLKAWPPDVPDCENPMPFIDEVDGFGDGYGCGG